MLLVLVVFSLCFTSAQALDCYVCSSATTNEACNQNSQQCQAVHDTCMTTVDIAGASKAIVKQCASKATCNGAAASASTDANGNGNIVTCCSAYNLCNYSGAETIHFQITLLSLTGVLLLLLK
ncbi:hypothetical protein WMY93_026845 [Mugilogobius chulae]|uniref:UPAR/Ly6 domain-containing protein n=1 Tax=Mugilogobius chulae TaxID=88201 RepID=A0AAW0N231_9GOBI